MNFQQALTTAPPINVRRALPLSCWRPWRGLLLALTLLGLTACTIGVEPEAIIMTGEPLYVTNCSQCHQLDGSGAEGLFPPLAGNPVVTLHDPAPLIDIIINGRGSMPPFRNTLDSEEAAAVISYIRNAWENEAAIVLPRQVPSN